MNFQRGKNREEPEINLIAMIDVLLVILIFLLVTSTYSTHAELQINLPQASGSKSTAAAEQINIAISATEHYAINNKPIKFNGVNNLSQALRKAAGSQADPTIPLMLSINKLSGVNRRFNSFVYSIVET